MLWQRAIRLKNNMLSCKPNRLNLTPLTLRPINFELNFKFNPFLETEEYLRPGHVEGLLAPPVVNQ